MLEPLEQGATPQEDAVSDDNNGNGEDTSHNEEAEVIELDKAREASVDAAGSEKSPEEAGQELFEKGKTVISDIVQKMMERLQETAQKAGDPENPNSIARLLDEARARTESGKAVLDEASRKKVVNLAAERLKRRGETGAMDLKEVFGEHFQQVAKKYAEVDDDGKPVLNVDGEFISKHGADVIPALVSELAKAFMESITGDVADPSALKATDDDIEAAGEVPKPQAESMAPKVDVKFDLMGVVGALFMAASEAQKRAEADQAVAEAEAELVKKRGKSKKNGEKNGEDNGDEDEA